MRVAASFGVLALVFIVSACAQAPSGPVLPEDYAEQMETHRVQRVERLRSSWLTLSGLHWLEEGDNRFGSDAANSIVFPADTSPAVAGNFVYQAGSVRLEPAPSAVLTLDGEPLAGGPVELEPDTGELGLGRLSFFLIERSGRHAIRVRDPEHFAVDQFRGIDFYPIDTEYVVVGTITAPDQPRTIPVETVIGSDAQMESRGLVAFELGGETHTLEAFAGSDKTEVFLIFKDGTSGGETYPAGRYLYATVENGAITLDFNRAYNPPCAFTPYATCPLPPPDNHIKARIEAGERSYETEKK